MMLRFAVLFLLVGAVVCGPSPRRTKAEVEEYRQFLQKSKHGNAYRSSSSELNPFGNIWEKSGKFEGDILLDDRQIDELVDSFAQGKAAYIHPNTKWPQNTLVYDFAPGHFNQQQRDYIVWAIGHIEHYSGCVRFRRRNSNDRNYVLITGDNNGCYASVGWWHDRGIHTLNLARSNPGTGCLHIVVIIHEFLHTLGFFHMQSTYNRYNYVAIHWQNMQRGMEHNFERYDQNLVSNLGLPYEHMSSMHYSSHAFSINRQPTITATRQHNGVMGQMEFVTHYDWVRLSRHYNCPGAWSAEYVEHMKEEVERTKHLMAPPQQDDKVQEEVAQEELA
ncbi:zinc metalloproteinase nas-4-like [Pieris napi]|uniref:zinc metalloproteinase nas-4-like n=1 Tax=Pieris napi TaxID=78633 RepID=UPI001FB95851|nr:zinc metalloproteinase nas-4-like [Pieris napi]